MYFVNDSATPILNTPDFLRVFGETLPFDDQNLIREVEMIALPQTLFKVIQKKEGTILEVVTEEYPSSIPLYVDRRSGTFYRQASPRINALPAVDTIIGRMKRNLGLPYVWGGNYSRGVPEWEVLYPPKKELSFFEKTHWTFQGVDCSGLLYEATDGFTPRNTSELMTFGQEVPLGVMKPLDLILFPGHVVIALGEDEVIESCSSAGGVVMNRADKRLLEIKEPFMIRRFHPTVL